MADGNSPLWPQGPRRGSSLQYPGQIQNPQPSGPRPGACAQPGLERTNTGTGGHCSLAVCTGSTAATPRHAGLLPRTRRGGHWCQPIHRVLQQMSGRLSVAYAAQQLGLPQDREASPASMTSLAPSTRPSKTARSTTESWSWSGLTRPCRANPTRSAV